MVMESRRQGGGVGEALSVSREVEWEFCFVMYSVGVLVFCAPPLSLIHYRRAAPSRSIGQACDDRIIRDKRV
jgi:hypothetical protein